MSTQVIEGYALSHQQTRLWRLARAFGSESFQTTITVRCDQPIESEKLAVAVDRLIERHEILRTSYQTLAGGGSTLQVIASEKQSPAVLTYKHDANQVTLTLPSLAADANSAKLFVRELFQLYSGASLDDPGVQYLQYSEYQKESLLSDEALEVRQRWQELDSGASFAVLPGLRESTNRKFSPRQIDIDPDGLIGLTQAGAALGVTSEAFLLAVWQVLIARFSGEREFRQFSEVDGRSFEELVNLPGALARMVPLSARVTPGSKFAELARTVHDKLGAVREFQEGYAEPDGSENSVTNRIAFSFIDASERIANGETNWTIERISSCSDRFQVRFHAASLASGVKAAIEYDPECFQASDARQCADSYCALLRMFIRDPLHDVLSAPLLSDDSRNKIVFDWNRTAVRYEEATPVHELFRQRASGHGDNAALQQGERTITFAELDARSDALALHLASRGIGPESFVGVYGHPSIEAVTGILGVLKSGAAYVPLDPSYPDERIDYILSDAAISHVLACRKPDAGWVEKVKIVNPFVETPIGDHAQLPGSASQLHSAYAIYTSGSTGTPKGVVVDHRGLTHYLNWCQSAYVAEATLGAPLHSSLAFDLTVTSLFAPLLAGQCVVIAESQSGPEGLTKLLQNNADFAWIKLTPGHARLIGEKLDRAALKGRTKLLIAGGEALTASDVQAWREADPGLRIVNEYGPTEAVVGCCVHTFEPSESGAVPIGRPIDNAQMYVLDEFMEPLPAGVTGEIYIGGDSLARGYLNRPAITAESFLPHPFTSNPGARLYRSGDLARLRHDGSLEYVGRRDHQVKIRGYRVELGEIEALLSQHPAIRDAAVLFRENYLVAYIAYRDSVAPPQLSSLRAFLSERLPEYMIPSLFITLGALPLTPNGKVDRSALPAMDSAHSGSGEGPRCLEEEVLTEIWAKVLDLDRVTIDDDYFVLGGDSIRAIQVVGHANQRGIDINIEMLFRHRTIRDLVGRIREGGEAAQTMLAPEPFCLISAGDRGKMPENVEDAYPLSALQAGMIFHRELHPESAIYHDIFGYHLGIPLDTEKLDDAARALVERHPALRTAFHLNDFSEALQLVHRNAPSPLAIDDISHLSSDEQDRALREWMDQEKRRGFDYHQPPLLRFQVHIRSAESFQFSLSFHHAIIDGWSDASMLVELAVSYQSLLDGLPIPFEAPTTRYREFVALERKALQSEDHRQFWMQKLRGCRPLFLPRWEQMSPSETGVRGVKLQQVPLSEEVSERLRQLARNLAVPLKSVLLAAHMRVMSALGGTTDVVSSLSSAGRPETVDANQVLGLHLNSTPMRLQLKGARWIDLIHDAFNEEREALPFRRYPLAEIQRLTGARRLSETSFYYTHYHNIERLTQLPKFEILGRIVYEETSFAMVANFNLDPFSGIIGLTLACDQTQFAADQRQWLGDYYERALNALTNNVEARYDHLDLLQNEERARLMWFSSGNAKNEIGDLESLQPVHFQIAMRAKSAPDALAVVCGENRLTYAELETQAGIVAERLRQAGARPDALVGLCMDRSTDLIVGILGILKSGAAYLPLDPEYPDSRLNAMIEDAKPCAILTNDRHAGLFASNRDVPVIRMNTSGLTETHAVVQPNLGNLAYVIFTSGSTGRPKGTLVTHENLAKSTAARHRFYLGPIKAFLLLPSFAFDSSVAGIFWTLTTGGTLILPQPGEQRSPESILELLHRHNVSHMLTLPTLYRTILDEVDKQVLPSLSTIIVAGEACLPRTINRHFEVFPTKHLFNEYGPTEATVWSTAEECAPLSESAAAAIGKAIPGARVYILDSLLQPVPMGVAGELSIGGGGVARGYLNRPELTAAAFLPDPFSSHPGSRLYRTGDSARFRKDGTLEYLGRIDNQVKIRGHRIELGEIEAVLRLDRTVDDAVVIAREQAPGDLRLIAYCVAPQQSQAARQGLRESVASKLPDYMVPSRFVFLDRLPRTPNGKVDRHALPAPDGTSDLADRYLPPRNAVEAKLAEIWAKALSLDRVGIEDDFFALGGDSILSIQIIARARESGLRFTPMDLFQRKTISALAPAVQTAIEAQIPAEKKNDSQATTVVGVSPDAAADLIARLSGKK